MQAAIPSLPVLLVDTPDGNSRTRALYWDLEQTPGDEGAAACTIANCVRSCVNILLRARMHEHARPTGKLLLLLLLLTSANAAVNFKSRALQGPAGALSGDGRPL